MNENEYDHKQMSTRDRQSGDRDGTERDAKCLEKILAEHET
jgi:hypothetical protein